MCSGKYDNLPTDSQRDKKGVVGDVKNKHGGTKTYFWLPIAIHA